jgi:hypothetical protein
MYEIPLTYVKQVYEVFEIFMVLEAIQLLWLKFVVLSRVKVMNVAF